jgi:hypothetical protein
MTRSHSPWRFLFVWVALALSGSAGARAADGPRTIEDRWYILQIEGKPSGWMHEVVTESADTREITSRSDSSIAIKRGAIKLVIESGTEFVETAGGKPLRATSISTTGKLKMVQKLTFTEKEIEIVTDQAGQSTRSTAPLPKEKWLPPAAAGRYVAQELKSKAKAITFTMMEPSTDLKPMTVQMTIVGNEDIEVLGKVVPALAVDTTYSNLPGVASRQYIDGEGRMAKMTMSPIPGFAITVLLADKDLAMAQIDPPEVLASTLIEMKTPIKDPRDLKSAVYELTFKALKGDKPGAKVLTPDLPKVGYQRVVWGDDQTAKVIVDLTEPVAPGNDLPKKEHLAASAALNHEDPKVKEIVELALKGVKPDASDMDKAEVLRKFVHRYIRKKDLSVGFAYAGEVARTKQGDCTEHGVLLAAMMRGAGLPSRTVSGLIYVDEEFIGRTNIFGYHMWAQCWIRNEKTGGTWVDFDATLEQPGFDAAHITLGVSALSDGEVNNDMVHLLPVIGRLEIKVVESKGKK